MATVTPSTSVFHTGSNVVTFEAQQAQDTDEVCEALKRYPPFKQIAAQALQGRPVAGINAEIVPVRLTINGKTTITPQLHINFYNDQNETWQFINVNPDDGFMWEAALFMVGRAQKPGIPAESQGEDDPGVPPSSLQPTPEVNTSTQQPTTPPSLEGRVTDAAAQGQDALLRTMLDIIKEFTAATKAQAEEHSKAIVALANNMHCYRHRPDERPRPFCDPNTGTHPPRKRASDDNALTYQPSAPPADNTCQPSAPPADNTCQPSAPPADKTYQPSAPPADNTRQPSAPPADNTCQPSAPPADNTDKRLASDPNDSPRGKKKSHLHRKSH